MECLRITAGCVTTAVRYITIIIIIITLIIIIYVTPYSNEKYIRPKNLLH